MKIYVFILLNLSFLACQPPLSSETEETQWKLKSVETTASSQSGEPNLFVAENGEVYLSWIEALPNEEHALKFSSWEDTQWSVPQTIAQDSGWFVNWADFPSMAVHQDFMAAHWLTKSDEGTFDYDVHVALSKDQGQSWSEPFVLHQDGIFAEHGFVSMLPYGDEIFAVWLDGRFTKSHAHETHEEGGVGAMTLYSTTFDQYANVGEEVELDHRICDCCQTDAVITDQGAVVVYRDRTEDEIRDIYITREQNGIWSEPQAVHADKWQINACPVNGPAIEAQGQTIAVVWFTGADNTPKVQLAFSDDHGATFGKPVRLDHGNPLGRVDVIMLNDTSAMVSWLEAHEEGAEIRSAIIDKKLNVIADKSIANTASSRSSGFPIMEKAGEQVFFAWTRIKGQSSKIMTAMLDMNKILP
ncbi:hypothetical protein OKW21_000892 [Catalinimonas alkaloidigena]|uniref:sialidase family protein n=1 Tax=Catalinimonas alkaloidigena TaxID=1075417 RepID=UPI002406EE47|nr:sialidase family protein [Catalinimonas alkaloidigena]MDF9795629.1 hypothetical protein [Catalinimonas alkaloidigena]